jgi:putative addiction module component (TIGR02574 family)
MSSTLEAISHDALVLPPDERVALAYRLIVSMEPAPESGTEAAWEAEIATRISRFDRGETQAISAANVLSALRDLAPGR